MNNYNSYNVLFREKISDVHESLQYNSSLILNII